MDNYNPTKNLKDSYKERIKVHGLFFGFFIIPALGLSMLMPMFFDAPGSGDSTVAKVLALAPMAYVVVTMASIALSWIIFEYKKYTAALYISLLPLLILLPFIVGFIIIIN